MKQSFLSSLLLLLLFSSHLSARLIADKQGKEEVELTQITDMEDTEVMNQLFGVELEESCETGDDECLKRRMISEAHLDYIYTQHHKP
ncbi:hypothetical protein V6N13_094628 [Hibiscus sabdariffa]|uniref:Uncharacterized protein n=2 Tax=Hibiscus sabdariffa TaxID=183260 RepID=A0ABR2PPM0_9ROSI